jgi:hypothetical protein
MANKIRRIFTSWVGSSSSEMKSKERLQSCCIPYPRMREESLYETRCSWNLRTRRMKEAWPVARRRMQYWQHRVEERYCRSWWERMTVQRKGCLLCHSSRHLLHCEYRCSVVHSCRNLWYGTYGMALSYTWDDEEYIWVHVLHEQTGICFHTCILPSLWMADTVQSYSDSRYCPQRFSRQNQSLYGIICGLSWSY